MKIPKVKCKICERRYSTQDEWKTQEEKEMCFTCYSNTSYLYRVVEFLNQKALLSNMRVRFEVIIHKLPISKKK